MTDMTSVDECISLFEKKANDFSERDIRRSVEFLHESATSSGLNSTDIVRLINNLCNTDIIGEETKEFIVTKCLVPSEFVDVKCITLVLSKLGIPTPLHPYKTVPSRRLQIALVKWVCHIYPWVRDASIFKDTFSMWFEYWGLDYLQHWISYILLWSFDDQHISKWRCKVLLNIGNNPGYKNSRSYAVYILSAFSTLESSHKDTISEYLRILNSNEKRVQSVAAFDYDKGYLLSLKQSLARNNIVDNMLFDEICRNYSDRNAYNKSDETSILPIEQLAKNWNHREIPYNFDTILNTESMIVWLGIAGCPKDDPRLLHLKKYINRNPDREALLMSVPFPLLHNVSDFNIGELIPCGDQDDHLFISSESEGLSKNIFLLCQLVFFACHTETSLHELSIYHTLLTKNALDSLLVMKSEAVLLFASLLLKVASLVSSPEHFLLVHALADQFTEQVLAINDSLLLSELCELFVNLKDHTDEIDFDKRIKSDVEKSIGYLIQYIWNHNSSNSESTLLPNIYWKSLSKSQYLTHTSFNPKFLYSLPNFGTMSFICQKLLSDNERKMGYHHFSGDFSESSLKRWITNNKLDIQWFPKITQFSDLRRLIVMMLFKDDRYNSISKFLFTYVKSLQNSI
ncbi:unnamed protein product [Kluyveromyces dobzhanskii CBS 2104]|uniref:WGS project CCBQ000000000 data, contig 00106 n=1 Tax=Kluyveromyces dobzhanskii CBS 2104 TaxID=1427455 RepID=A0A0A8L5L7_9SACH|nr:unnamed protein product [Kluyveromyces dobzhanskii CBS 2104]